MDRAPETCCLELIRKVLLPAGEKLQKQSRPPLGKEYLELLAIHKELSLERLAQLEIKIETEISHGKRLTELDGARVFFIVRCQGWIPADQTQRPIQ